MFNIIFVILNFIGVGVSFIGNIIKHPIFIKTAFVGVFFSLMLYTMDYMIALTVANMSLQSFDVAQYLGVTKAIQVYISLASASYVANHMLTYFKNF